MVRRFDLPFWLCLLASVAPTAPARADDVQSAHADLPESDYGKLLRACSLDQPAAAHFPPLAISALALRPIGEIVPVPATDNSIHLAYAAQVTNVAPTTTIIEQIVPADPQRDDATTGSNSVLDVDGAEISGKVRLFNPKLAGDAKRQVDFDSMPGGTSGMTFFDVRYSRPSDVPHALAHRIRLRQDGGDPIVVRTDPVRVGCPPTAILSPPLVGSGWWNGNGCCEIVGPHRGATLPINGEIRVPEGFAIDYVQLDASGSCCNGKSPKKNENWTFFGAPILASADGQVVEMENDMPEQTPGSVVGVTASNAAGNHIVQSIGGGVYIMYAHLRTHSIPAGIKVGSSLSRGTKIGELGNTGSSTAPHLHFQVMDRPSTLDANGLPFVFDEQRLEGMVIGTAAATNDAFEAGEGVKVDHRATGARFYRMPAAMQVFGYHLN